VVATRLCMLILGPYRSCSSTTSGSIPRSGNQIKCKFEAGQPCCLWGGASRLENGRRLVGQCARSTWLIPASRSRGARRIETKTKAGALRPSPSISPSPGSPSSITHHARCSMLAARRRRQPAAARPPVGYGGERRGGGRKAKSAPASTRATNYILLTTKNRKYIECYRLLGPWPLALLGACSPVSVPPYMYEGAFAKKKSGPRTPHPPRRCPPGPGYLSSVARGRAA
jgi:hypothetical protein